MLKSFFNNKVLNIIVISTIIIQIFISIFLRSFFSLNYLNYIEYLKIISFSLSIIVFSEFIRFFRRVFNK
ncbi:MAG: cation transporting ATPase C-terminal domain-containing protein [Cetobacterium sp.]